MSLFEALILAVVQGITEFLPVSSSGHLVLFSHLLGIHEPTIAYEILLHFGTLGAIFVAFWSDTHSLIQSGLRIIRQPKQIVHLWKTDPGVRILLAIIIGTLPTVVVALLAKDFIVSLFRAPGLTGYMLIVTGTIIYITDRATKGKKPVDQITLVDGLIIGIGQTLAILPGISRSGTTIGTGLLRGLDRESAARFSFLLTIPAILGAMILAIDDLLIAQTVTTPFWILTVGTLLSGITGYLAIQLLLQFVRKGRLIVFSYYTWAVGLLIILLQFR